MALVVKNPPASAGDWGSIPGSGRFPWRRAWEPTPVLLPGESHGQRSLAGYSPRGCRESDMTEATQYTRRQYEINMRIGKKEQTQTSLQFPSLAASGSHLLPPLSSHRVLQPSQAHKSAIRTHQGEGSLVNRGYDLNTQFPEARGVTRPGTVCQKVPEDAVTRGSKSRGSKTRSEAQVRVSGSRGWEG